MFLFSVDGVQGSESDVLEGDENSILLKERKTYSITESLSVLNR